MDVFSLAPAQNVNKGLATTWQNLVPQQLDLLKSAAGLGLAKANQDAEQQQQRRASAMKWWDDYKISYDGLTTEQKPVVSSMYREYLDKYASDISGGYYPVNQSGVVKDRDTISRTISSFMESNKEVGGFQSLLKDHPEQYGYLKENDLVPMIYDNVITDAASGSPKINIPSGSVLDFVSNDPRSIRTWDGDWLYGRHKKTYMNAHEEWLKTHSADFGDQTTDYLMKMKYEGPDIWVQSERSKGKWVLKPDYVDDIHDNDPDYYKWLVQKAKDLTEKDPSNPVTINDIAYQQAYKNARGVTTIDKIDEATSRTDKLSGADKVKQDQQSVLDTIYKAVDSKNNVDITSALNTVSNKLQGIDWQYVINQTFRLKDQKDADGNDKKITVTGWIPRLDQRLIQNIDLMKGMALSENDFQRANMMTGKQTEVQNVYLPDYALDVSSLNNMDDAQRHEYAQQFTLTVAQLANVMSPGAQQYYDSTLNEWKTKEKGVFLFGNKGKTDEPVIVPNSW